MSSAKWWPFVLASVWYWQCIEMISPTLGVTKLISSLPLFFEFFSIIKTHISYWIPRLFIDRCHRSSAAVAPVKYKCDSNYLRGTFAWWKRLLAEKLTNGALVTPPPGQFGQTGSLSGLMLGNVSSYIFHSQPLQRISVIDFFEVAVNVEINKVPDTYFVENFGIITLMPFLC